jgi:hypothetical protein
VISGDALERIAHAQERLAAAAEESTRLLRALVEQQGRQEAYLDVLASHGEYSMLGAAEAAAAGKMHLEHLWGVEPFRKRWGAWRKSFEKNVSGLTPVSVLRRSFQEAREMDKGEGTSKGKGKEKAREVVEEETLDADGEEAESGGEDEDMEETE